MNLRTLTERKNGFSIKYEFNLIFDEKAKKVYLENEFLFEKLKTSESKPEFIIEDNTVYIKLPINERDYIKNMLVVYWAALKIKPDIESSAAKSEVFVDINNLSFKKRDTQKEEHLVEVIGWQKLMNIELEVF
jgi:hypothetical protein